MVKQDGFQIMAAILFLPFENRTRLFSSASLNRFGINKIFLWLFSYKTVKASHSKTGHCCPVIEWSGFQMPGTGIRSNPKTDHGSVFRWWLYFTPPSCLGMAAPFVPSCFWARCFTSDRPNNEWIRLRKWQQFRSDVDWNTWTWHDQLFYTAFDEGEWYTSTKEALKFKFVTFFANLRKNWLFDPYYLKDTDDLKLVGIQIPDIQNPEPFENQPFTGLVIQYLSHSIWEHFIQFLNLTRKWRPKLDGWQF
jgi:hypothetical protein